MENMNPFIIGMLVLKILLVIFHAIKESANNEKSYLQKMRDLREEEEISLEEDGLLDSQYEGLSNNH